MQALLMQANHKMMQGSSAWLRSTKHSRIRNSGEATTQGALELPVALLLLRYVQLAIRSLAQPQHQPVRGATKMYPVDPLEVARRPPPYSPSLMIPSCSTLGGGKDDSNNRTSTPYSHMLIVSLLLPLGSA